MITYVIEYSGTDFMFERPRRALQFSSRKAAVEYMRQSKWQWKQRGWKVTGNIHSQLSYFFAGSTDPAVVEVISTDPNDLGNAEVEIVS